MTTQTDAEVDAEYQAWCRLHPQDADTFALYVLATTPHRLSARAIPEEDDDDHS